MEQDARSKMRRVLDAPEPRRQDPPPVGGGNGEDDDSPINRLPIDVLGNIISFLPTKDGGRTQILSNRWRPLWRTAPLNLQVNTTLSTLDPKRISAANKILSTHEGPARRFCLLGFRLRNRLARIDGWLRSPALNGLQEIDFSYSIPDAGVPHPLPPSALRFAPTLRVASFGDCDFPNEMAPLLHFPELRELSLSSVNISEEALHSLIAACRVLESLFLEDNDGIGRVRIRSKTLKIIGFSGPWKVSSLAVRFQELVIEDAPSLERLLQRFPDNGPATIRVMQAPKLEMVGMLAACNSRLEIGATVLQEMIAQSITTTMRSVKVLSINSLGPNLNSVVDFLKCFPCMEELHITYDLQKTMNNARTYDPLDPIECLELHLKKVVMNDYHGMKPDVDFAKFFVLNAKVLKVMEFGAHSICNDKWMANQCRRLQLDNKASPRARFTFAKGYGDMSFPRFEKANPFERANPKNFLTSATYF